MSDAIDDLPLTEEWFYCIEHGSVETRGGCKITDRLGPYPTREAASAALDRVEDRNDDWDHDPNWNDDEDADRVEPS
ncbi:MAG: hypothetical protein KJO36_12520 [Acidimicrobiia bacterium]|nr:hypothetical protein [Acidimicrobiia bacterium]NNC43258.1 hypothetical protein [Acidimicrobiia bacterium]NND13135.1 hypothetical protein [Acidimicrobiia bacterium]